MKTQSTKKTVTPKRTTVAKLALRTGVKAGLRTPPPDDKGPMLGEPWPF